MNNRTVGYPYGKYQTLVLEEQARHEIRVGCHIIIGVMAALTILLWGAILIKKWRE